MKIPQLFSPLFESARGLTMYRIAQVNIGRVKGPLDGEVMAAS